MNSAKYAQMALTLSKLLSDERLAFEMRTFVTTVAVLILALGAAVGPAAAVDVGDRVELVSTNPAGVPLHDRSGNSFRGERAADKANATIVGSTQNGQWLQIRLDDGRVRWIIRKYVGHVVSDIGSQPIQGGEAQVWESPEGCREIVDSGGRMGARTSANLRLATWNIRWFPDGENHPKGKDATKFLNMAWLKCALAWLNVDIVAVQEIKKNTSADEQLEVLAEGLTAELGGEWQTSMQDCGHKGAQRVGFLWDAERVALSNIGSLWRFNARATSPDKPCEPGRRRPGHYARVEASGGGVDFHLVSVHLKSGTKEEDRASRVTALRRIPEAVAPLLPVDGDIIILGDFNTMGSGNDASSRAEIDALRDSLGGQIPSWRHVEADPACTEYYKGKGKWLDHVVATSGMTEFGAHTAKVTGYCGVAGCGALQQPMPRAYLELSDHCPDRSRRDKYRH